MNEVLLTQWNLYQAEAEAEEEEDDLVERCRSSGGILAPPEPLQQAVHAP